MTYIYSTKKFLEIAMKWTCQLNIIIFLLFTLLNLNGIVENSGKIFFAEKEGHLLVKPFNFTLDIQHAFY